jgi:hypothetical protein
MKRALFAAAFILSVMVSPTVASAVMTLQPSNAGSSGGASITADFGACSTLARDGLGGVVNCLVAFFNAAIYLLISLSVLYTMYGAFIMISNEEKRDSGKQIIYHGIIGLFVMVSIWGFVNILNSTFRLSSQGPITPQPLIAPAR